MGEVYTRSPPIFVPGITTMSSAAIRTLPSMRPLSVARSARILRFPRMSPATTTLWPASTASPLMTELVVRVTVFPIASALMPTSPPIDDFARAKNRACSGGGACEVDATPNAQTSF